MSVTAIYWVACIDSNGEWRMLEGFVGDPSKEFAKAKAALPSWRAHYHGSTVDILRKA